MKEIAFAQSWPVQAVLGVEYDLRRPDGPRCRFAGAEENVEVWLIRDSRPTRQLPLDAVQAIRLVGKTKFPTSSIIPPEVVSEDRHNGAQARRTPRWERPKLAALLLS